MSYGEFVQVDGGAGTPQLWQRLPLGDTGGRNEAWLRDLLHANPSLIPIGEIDPSFGPLIPVCTELRTPAGPIDNVFIDRHGRLTLVECKLWRNPEARRKVVAQVLDYAKELSTWSYADFQRQVSARTSSDELPVFSRVHSRHPELSEHQFADAVARALRGGRFQLLIAGDGIREDVKALGELINRNATSGYSFGMFEVAIYRGPRGELLVQPRTLVRTQIIERTVIVVREESGETTLKEVDPSESTDSEPASIDPAEKASAEAWWAPVLAAKLDDPEQPNFRYYWIHNIRGSLPWPGTWLLAYRTSGPKARVGVSLRGRELPLLQLLQALEPDIDSILAELPEGVEFVPGSRLSIQKDWGEFANDDERREWLRATLNAFVNELRPRISRLREMSQG
ncbi:hypothetical protein WG922_16795 [Ramlibacter sp. AN1015]|uniref:hypothetical protein n=1 Tax=Ramlibacter sp. AN1015 TaxID=3133428 RepID=UPI0030C45DC8